MIIKKVGATREQENLAIGQERRKSKDEMKKKEYVYMFIQELISQHSEKNHMKNKGVVSTEVVKLNKDGCLLSMSDCLSFHFFFCSAPQNTNFKPLLFVVGVAYQAASCS